MSEETEAAVRDYDKATAQLGRLASSSPLSKRRHVEAEYSKLYQRLVRLGVYPQIRGKYRTA
jgi:hypothetical protein